MTGLAVKVEHVNPFILSTMETFTKMVGVEAKAGKLMLKNDKIKLSYDISGIIGLSGGAKGMVSMSFPKASALKVTNKFMGSDYNEINKDVIDGIGELANIVAGNAKKGLTEFNISISLPNVIMGENHQIMDPKDVISFIIPFHTTLGDFHLTVALKST